MKLIKKIAAIMLSVMMVLGMASVVSAEGSGATATPTGTITINNTIAGQAYKIYKILDLESYDADAGNYVYKVDSDWEKFINGTEDGEGAGGAYLEIIDTTYKYVKWKGTNDNTRTAEFAKKALEYAKSKKIIPRGVSDANDTTSTTVTFNNLPLGYYVVESSVGALCGLTTTNPIATILEKNGVPSVEKKVQEDSKVGKTDEWGNSNTADIGQTVNFQTTITAQQGAQKYVLHDKMAEGLTFDGTVTVTKNGKNVDAANYTLKKSTDSPATITDKCTFEIEFTQTFCDTLKANDQIIVTYSATLNEKAVIAGDGNTNETWLKYGENSETTHDTTTTKTYSIPVFKYTTKDGNKTALAGAIFTLSKNSDGSTPIELVSVSENTTTGDIYRVAKENEAEGTTKITAVTTTASGKFTIKGLDADTYYLTETQQPAGYNKLSAPIKIKIGDDGKVSILKSAANGKENSEDITDYVKVLNNTGTILPTTGGNGTSLIYFLGAVLALVSGVVLITKQRMKNS